MPIAYSYIRLQTFTVLFSLIFHSYKMRKERQEIPGGCCQFFKCTNRQFDVKYCADI